jgi:hypothetical protein
MIYYACIKNNIVENTIFLEEKNNSLIERIQEEFLYDQIVDCSDFVISIGFSYDGNTFFKENGSPAFKWDDYDPDNIISFDTIKPENEG